MKIRELRSGEPRGVEGKRLRYRAVAETCATLIALEMRTTEAVDAVPESDPVISAQSPSGAAHAQSGEQDGVPLSLKNIADSNLDIAAR